MSAAASSIELGSAASCPAISVSGPCVGPKTLGPVGARRPQAAVRRPDAASSAVVDASSAPHTTTSKRSGVKSSARSASGVRICSTSMPSCRAATSLQSSAGDTTVTCAVLVRASANARSSVHSHASARSGARIDSS